MTSSTTEAAGGSTSTSRSPPPFVPPLRKACDECHSLKVKCNPCVVEGGSESSSLSSSSICQRCHRLSLTCKFSPADIKTKRQRKKRRVDGEQGQGQGQGQARLVAQPSTSPTFALSLPNPPLMSDFSSVEWEGWFRDLPLGGGPNASAPDALTAYPPSTTVSAQTPATTFDWRSSVAGSSTAVTGPSHTMPHQAVDQESMMRSIFGLDPCFSFHGAEPSAPSALTPRELSLQDLANAATATATATPSVRADSPTTVPTATNTHSSSHLSIEARLSYLSLEFSAALDQCDPSRTSAGTAASNPGQRDAAESRLLGLFARADQVWCEMDQVGADRMKKMYDVLGEDSSAKADGITDHNIIPPAGNGTLASRYSKSLQGPFTSAGAMLALSLSFQMLDALRLLSSLLDAPQDTQRQSLCNVMQSFHFESEPLVASLHLPILTFLRDHYLHRLIDKLDHVINYARTWHHVGEAMGPGPHDSCAVQIQGAKVKGDLEALQRRFGRV